MDALIQTILDHFGSQTELANFFGNNRQDAHKWIKNKRIPIRYWGRLAANVPSLTVADIYFAHYPNVVTGRQVSSKKDAA